MRQKLIIKRKLYHWITQLRITKNDNANSNQNNKYEHNYQTQTQQQKKNVEKERDISGLFFDDLEGSKSSRSIKSNRSAVQQSFEEEQPKPIIFTNNNNKDNMKDVRSPGSQLNNGNRGKLNLDDLSENKSKTNTDEQVQEDVDFEVMEDEDQMFRF